MHYKLKEYRLYKGFTQEQLSKNASLTQATYSRKESGKSKITPSEWGRFSKALSVSVEELKGGEVVHNVFSSSNLHKSLVFSVNKWSYGAFKADIKKLIKENESATIVVSIKNY